jgi:chloramphenicol-sensitive protein RarD
MTESRRGLLYAIAAYGIWGLFPLYWGLLKPAGALEILGHRIVWSLVSVLVLLAVLRRWGWFKTVLRSRRTTLILVGASVLIAVNWFTYIYGVNSGHVVETALGYFINPLVSMLLGVVVLRERLRRVQWAALGIGAAAVAVLTIDYGRPPWFAIVLAVSFGLYGLLKKMAGAPAAEGLAFESGVLVIPALACIIWLEIDGSAAFGHVSVGHALLMMGAGLFTAIPLLFFAGAANRVPLSTMGIVQYLAPLLQFLIGITIAGEHMPPARWAGFALVWLALVIFTLDGVRSAGRQRASRPPKLVESAA